MSRLAMVVDTKACIGCMDCVVACNVENDVPPGQRRSWVKSTASGRFPKVTVLFESQRCNHCDNPPCVPVCPTGASHVSAIGNTVQVNAYKCIKCGECVSACPYEARFLNPAKLNIADKCTFCTHRVQQGLPPACVAVCPAQAMSFGDLDDPASPVNQLLKTRKHYVLKPSLGTGPRVFYLT